MDGMRGFDIPLEQLEAGREAEEDRLNALIGDPRQIVEQRAQPYCLYCSVSGHSCENKPWQPDQGPDKQ